ncbi:hypothetical protein HY612_02695 [Candidatus Roizmanbacteria bacterium]|nr:hypothetical protein [Candidatus Roizmanbacteria bacterium]
MNEQGKSWYDNLRPWAIGASIGLLAIGVAAAAFDLALDPVIEYYRNEWKKKAKQD